MANLTEEQIKEYKETGNYQSNGFSLSGKIGLINCPNCKYYGGAYKTKKGSGGVEFILWLLFLVVGLFSYGLPLILPLIYSIWRSGTKIYRCPQCNYEYVILKKEANKFEDLQR